MCTPPSMPTGLTSRPPGLFCRTSRPLYCGGGLNCPPRFIWGPCFDQGAGLCAISLSGPIYADTPIYDRLTLMAVYICIHNGPNQFIVRSSLLYFSGGWCICHTRITAYFSNFSTDPVKEREKKEKLARHRTYSLHAFAFVAGGHERAGLVTDVTRSTQFMTNSVTIHDQIGHET